jgi:glycerate-2-kinase
MGDSPEDLKSMVNDIVGGIVEAISPERIIDSFVGNIRTSSLFKKNEDLFLVGMGKSAQGMVTSFMGILDENGIDTVQDPIAVLPESSWKGLKQGCRVLEGNHPVPGSKDIANMDEVMDVISSLEKNTKILFLLSGGASSLSFHPRPGVDPDRKASVISSLLEGGADIATLNKARTYLSDTKGGGLLCSGPDLVWNTVSFSDVSGDDPRFIGSGPTHQWEPDPDEVKSILRHYQTEYEGLNLRKLTETPRIFCKANLVDSTQWIAANNGTAVGSAASVLEKMGFAPAVGNRTYRGDAKVTASKLLQVGRVKIRRENADCFVAGGETTVTVTGNGNGGRNSEMITSLIGELEENEIVICMGTDGADGSWEGAGGWITGTDSSDDETRSALENNDTGTYLRRIGRDIKTGPTGNNLADIFILLHHEEKDPRLHRM